MKNRLGRPSPAMAVALCALFAALGGSAYAASQIETADIAKQAVTGSKIAKETIKGSKLRADTINGTKINEATLGEVPTATNAVTAQNASNVAGREAFNIGLADGQSQTLATNGTVSMTAVCDTDAGSDRIRILGATTAPNAVQAGTDFFPGNGPTPFLEPNTPADDRVILENTNSTTGEPQVINNIDRGFVYGADSKGLSIDGEETVIGLNYGGQKCILGGVVNKIG